MEGSAKYRSSPLYRSVYIATRVAGCSHAYVAARVARYGHTRCPTMCTAVLVYKSEKHSFPVTNVDLAVVKNLIPLDTGILR